MLLGITICIFGALQVNATPYAIVEMVADGGGGGGGGSSSSMTYLGQRTETVYSDANTDTKETRYEYVFDVYTTTSLIYDVPVEQLFSNKKIDREQTVTYQYGDQITSSYSYSSTFEWKVTVEAEVKFKAPVGIVKEATVKVGAAFGGTYTDTWGTEVTNIKINNISFPVPTALNPLGMYSYHLYAVSAYKQRVIVKETVQQRTKGTGKNDQWTEWTIVGTPVTNEVMMCTPSSNLKSNFYDYLRYFSTSASMQSYFSNYFL